MTETFIVSVGVKEQKVASYITDPANYKQVVKGPSLREAAEATGLPSRHAFSRTLRRLLDKQIIIKKGERYEWHPRFKGDVTTDQEQKSKNRQKGH